MNKKRELRKQMALLKKQYHEQNNRFSAEIMAVLEAHPLFQSAQTVLLYHSLPDEVNTHSFIEQWGEKKRILLPVVVGDELELRLFTPSVSLANGAYGIAEPTGEAFAKYDEITFAVIPGVAFDHTGNRLGRGKGYYDRLLPHLSKAFKVGICFPYQLVKTIPTEPFDIPMDSIITIE